MTCRHAAWVMPEASNANKQARRLRAPTACTWGAGTVLLPAGPPWLQDTCRAHPRQGQQHRRGEGLEAAAGSPHTSWEPGCPEFIHLHQSSGPSLVCAKLCDFWGPRPWACRLGHKVSAFVFCAVYGRNHHKHGGCKHHPFVSPNLGFRS